MPGMMSNKGEALVVAGSALLPTVIFLIFALIAGLGRFGRGLAITTIVFAVLGSGWLSLLVVGFDEVATKSEGVFAGGGGLTLMATAAVLALIAGIVGTAKPELKKQQDAPVPAAA